MARKGRVDRGLVQRQNTAGKVVWYVRLYYQGRERQFGSFPTKTEAREFYEKSKHEQKLGRFFPERFQRGDYEFVETVIDRYLTTIATKKLSTQKGDIFFGAWWKEQFKGKRLDAITPAALEDIRKTLLSKAVRKSEEQSSRKTMTPARVNRYMEWLRHLLNGALRDGKLASNSVSRLKLFKEPKGRTRFLSPEEEGKLMHALGPTYGPWARLATLTGMRQMEQFSLRWNQIDFTHNLIVLPMTKSGDAQWVYLNDEAKCILLSMKTVAEAQAIADKSRISPFAFPSRNPETHLNPINFYKRIWTRAIEDAGIEWCTWHDLRHTFASRLAMNGHQDRTIAELLRHSTTALVKRYAHLSPSHLRSVLEGISKFGTESKGQN